MFADHQYFSKKGLRSLRKRCAILSNFSLTIGIGNKVKLGKVPSVSSLIVNILGSSSKCEREILLFGAKLLGLVNNSEQLL